MSLIQILSQRLTSLLAALTLFFCVAFITTPIVYAQTELADSAAVKPVESAENPYGLKAIVDHGDMVSKGVLGILLIMSVSTWIIMISKLVEQRKVLAEANKVSVGAPFWVEGSLQKSSEGLTQEGAFRYVTEVALEADKNRNSAAGMDYNEWLSSALDEANEEVEHRMQKGLGFLATVGSTSPFIGLFGTVWGILNALTSIGLAGQASIDKVAGPVGEALIMTAIGLAVAVPAVMGYNWLVGRNASALRHVTTFSSRLRTMLLSSTKRA